MANHDELHQWWWSEDGPRVQELTVSELNRRTENVPERTENRVVHGKGGAMLSASGWNYAVLRFLIVYCNLDDEFRQVLQANSNPKGRYGVWKKEQFSNQRVRVMKEKV